MVLLEKLWDDVLAGPQPDRGLGRLRKITATNPLIIKDIGEGEGSKYQRSMSMPASPATPGTPVSPSTPSSARKDNVWRSVFHPGSNLATKTIGSNVFDKPQPNTPTVYDWSREDRSNGTGLVENGGRKPPLKRLPAESAGIFDPNRLYSGETRSKHHR